MSDMDEHSTADLDASEVFSTLTESGVIDPDVIHDIIGVEIAVSTSASPVNTPPPPQSADLIEDDQQDSHIKAEEELHEKQEDRDDTDSITTTNSDHSSVKPSRELKSILAMAKEAKLDTNISHRRKPMENVKPGRGESPKITKEEHQETVKKIIKIVASDNSVSKVAKYPVTAESEIETQSDDEKMPNKVKRKRDSFSELSPGGTTDEIVRKAKKSFAQQDIIMFKEGKDSFCWRCHRDGVNIACETCSRSYHQKCLKQVIVDVDHWPCPECVAILKAESTSTRSEAMKGMTLEHLCSLLKFAVHRMVQCTGSEPFIHPVNEKEFPVYKKYIIQPMNLTLLEKNIKDNVYGSTQAFEADAKWILHNSIIFNSYQSKITTAARGIVKICKQEMAEIENCPSCYLNANTKKNTWFVEVCPRPHLLVWAKLKGFPYWPAKAMCTNSAGMVDVRFFGAHDRAWVHYRDCYLYSERDPNSYKQRRYDIENCVKELQMYVKNLKKIYGEVNLAQFKTLYDPNNELKMLRVLLPTYNEAKMKVLRVYEKSSNSETKKDDEETEKAPELQVKTEQPDEDMNESQQFNSSTIDGYGTDEDNKCGLDPEKRKMLELSTNDEVLSDKVGGEEEDFSQLKIHIANKLLIKKGLNNFSRITSRVSTDKKSSDESLTQQSPDKSRRNSDQSVGSDASRRTSNASDTGHRMDIDENTDQSMSNASTSSSISEKSTKSDGNKNNEQERVVKVVESAELSISPQSKLKITDKLIKRLSDGDEVAQQKTFGESSAHEETRDSDCSSTTSNNHEKQCEDSTVEKTADKTKENQVESVNSTVDDDDKEDKLVIDQSEEEKQDGNDDEKVEESKEDVSEKENSVEKEDTFDKSDKNTNIIEEFEDSEGAETMDSSQINEADIRNIIHSSLNDGNVTIHRSTPKEKPKIVSSTPKTDVTSTTTTTTESKKRKLSTDEAESQPKTKSIKVININKVIDKKLLTETIESSKRERAKEKANADKMETDSNDSCGKKRVSIEEKDEFKEHDHEDQTIPQDLLAIEIKSEQETDDEYSDTEYMEAKRKYLSALNISEKSKETTKEKLHEIRTRSKTEEKKERCRIDNLTKIIDEVALNTSGGRFLNQANKSGKKKLYATVLTSLNQTMKTSGAEIYVKSLSKLQSPKQRARKTFPTPKYDKQSNGTSTSFKEILPKPGSNVTVAKVIVSTSSSDPITILSQSQKTPEVVLIPTNPNSNITPNLSMLPPLIATKSLKPINPNTKQSQNYIPQNENDSDPRLSLLDTILTNTALSKTATEATSSTQPPLVPTTSITPIISTTTSNAAAASTASASNQSETPDELSILHTTVPRTVSKAVSDLLCRTMPKLRPRPPGALSTTFDSGMPSSAGPATAKINSLAHRFSDYFRGMLVETLDDLSKTEETEATVVKLKLEIEALKHKHEVEMAEMQRNITTILKDIQTSIVEERNRVIEQVRATSEAEAQRRVEEAKSKQWCANCSKEAQFYCCWNTSYCDYPCQQKHWPKHMNKCTQSQNQSNTSASPATIRSQSGQPIVLRPANPPKGAFNRVFTKPTKVYMNRTGVANNSAGKSITAFKTSTNNHITVVEAGTAGTFELVTNGPTKIITATTKPNDVLATSSKQKPSQLKSVSVSSKSNTTNKSQTATENESDS